MNSLQKNNKILEEVGSDAAIRVKNLTKAYKLYPSGNYRLKEALHPFRKKYHQEFYALKNVSFEVKKGEVLGIIGKNGSGKSTLLKIISGVLQPTSGEVQTHGNISALLELGSGFNPEYTGIDNIYFYGSIMGLTKEEMDDKREEILSFADIGDFIFQPLLKYSSGMVARLAFATAINIDPEILIVDEVLAVGDELFRRKCYAKIEKFMDEGRTILFVAHSTATINELCTSSILLDQGDLILEGPPKLVTAQYERFLYAKPENTAKVRSEVVRMNQNEELKKKIVQKLSKKELQQKQSARKEDQEDKDIENIAKKITVQSPLYIQDLKPKSSVEYKDYDVEIKDIKMETPNGKKVNMIVIGQKYVYSYKVHFGIDAEDVAFGVKFKTEKGIVIGGAGSYGMKKSIDHVLCGEEFIIKWHFKCILLPGTYYTNIGVTSMLNEERVILNRISDSMIFKVLHNENTGYSGFVDFDFCPEIIKRT